MEGIKHLTKGFSLAAREETVVVFERDRLLNLNAEHKGALKSCTLASKVKPFKQELKDAKRGGNSTRSDESQSKGVKRKTLDAPEGQGFEIRDYHMSSATIDKSVGEEVEGSARRLASGPKGRNGQNGGDYSSRFEKRLKLKTSITSGTKQRSDSEGGRGAKEDGQRMINLSMSEKVQTRMEDGKSTGPTEDKKGKAIRGLNDEFKKKSDAQDRWKVNHHDYLGADFERSRMTHRRERDTENRTNGQHLKEHPEEDCPGVTRKSKVDFRHSTTSVHKGKNPTVINRDCKLDRSDVNWGRGTIPKPRSGEDSKSRRDAPKRCREEVDGIRERDGEVFFEGHDMARGEKRLPRDRSDPFRSGEFEEENFEGRWDRQVIGEEDRKHGDSRRHGKHSRHNWKMDNGIKSYQHEEDSLTKLRANRRFQVYPSPATIDKPRSCKDGYLKGTVEHQGQTVTNTHKQNATGIAHNHWQDDQYHHRDGHKSYTKADHDKSLPRNQRKMEKTGKKEKHVENGLRLVMQTSRDQNSSKENVDHSSRGTRGTDQLGDMDIKVPSQTSEAVGGSRRSYSSNVVALNQPGEQDVQGVTDQNGGKGQRACIEATKLETCSQRNSTLGNKISKLPNLEAAKSFGEECGGAIEGSRQMGVEVDHGPETATEEMLQQSMSSSPMLEKRERKFFVEISEGREKPRGTSAHRSEKLVNQEGQEFKSILEKRVKDGFQIEGTAKQKSFCTEKDVQERTRSDSRTTKKFDEALTFKRTKSSMKKKKVSNESLLRRQVVDVDRHKRDVSSRDHKRQKRGGRSHSVSPKKHKHCVSPKAHGKSTSPRRSERYRSDWDKFERGRRKTLAPFDSRYRRFGGGTSGLGGYSPRRRRSEAAVKTPSPPPRSPERKKEKAWDSVPPGMDSSMIAAISAAHQAAMQHALATLATVNPLVPSNMLISPTSAPSLANRLTAVPSLLSSLQPQINPASVTLTQATRPMRRLYVGNVPSTVSDGELLEFMNAAMLSANANYLLGTKPCINCSVNMEKNHAFAEFITPEDATAALAFDGVTLHGTTLKIRRPKDFVLPANRGIENLSAVPDMVSSRVVDSPHKVFVGGIPSSLTADKVKEIVAAFGQLKAYHWEVDNKKQPPQAFAFLEYLDPTVTVTACAGLNGMRLGKGFLTVVQATPNADTKSASNTAPFYGIPEHAKSLLEPPTSVLELHNLVAPEDVSNMSKEDIEELIEDVRLECIRFGNVKATHMVHQRSYCELQTGNTPSLGIIEGAAPETSKGDTFDRSDVLELAQENVAQKDNHVGLTETPAEMSSGPAKLELGTSIETDDKQLPTGPADGLPSGHLCEENGTTIEENNCHLHEFCAIDTGIAKSQKVSEEFSNEWQDSTGASQMEKIIPTDAQEFVRVRDQDIGGLTSGSGQGDVSMRDWENSHLGKVYVEFSREESACQAAHALHGRLFDGRKVAVGYFPLESYQKRFQKGLGRPTFEEKQSLALAVHVHLTADIED